MANDYRRLKEEADIQTVVDQLGMQVWQKGSAYFVLCPLPGHDDHHPTNCYFKRGWNNLYCNTCGKAINAIDLIMYVTGLVYGAAADLLWEIEGRPDWYYEDWKQKKKPDKPEFRITREEAEMIGFHFPGHVLAPANETEWKEELPRGYEYRPQNADTYLKCKVCNLQYTDFWSYQDYKIMVRGKVTEALLNTLSIRSFLLNIQECVGRFSMNDMLLQACNEKGKLCISILKRFEECA